MARAKMRSHQLIEAAVWGGIAVATVAGAYTLSGLIAHWGTYIPWR